MKWINYFSASTIPFSVYKIAKGDSILYHPNQSKSKSLLIIDGLVYLLKIFTNNEILSVALLNKNHIINIMKTYNNNYFYYKAVAIKDTFCICFVWEELKNNFKCNNYLLIELIESYQKTIYQYEIINNIIAHRYIKNRIVQLILFLSTEFGIVNKQNIIIPLEISQTTIGIIIGSNRITVNQILQQLYKQNIISYSPQKYIILHDPLALNYFIFNQ